MLVTDHLPPDCIEAGSAAWVRCFFPDEEEQTTVPNPNSYPTHFSQGGALYEPGMDVFYNLQTEMSRYFGGNCVVLDLYNVHGNVLYGMVGRRFTSILP